MLHEAIGIILINTSRMSLGLKKGSKPKKYSSHVPIVESIFENFFTDR